METFSASLAICTGNSPVTGEFPAQKPVTRSFDVFLDLRLNKRLSKQSWGWWFKTTSRPLWRHRSDIREHKRDLGFVLVWLFHAVQILISDYMRQRFPDVRIYNDQWPTAVIYMQKCIFGQYIWIRYCHWTQKTADSVGDKNANIP